MQQAQLVPEGNAATAAATAANDGGGPELTVFGPGAHVRLDELPDGSQFTHGERGVMLEPPDDWRLDSLGTVRLDASGEATRIARRHLRAVCANLQCTAGPAVLALCGDCVGPGYCSQDCFVLGWPAHRPDCARLRARRLAEPEVLYRRPQ